MQPKKLFTSDTHTGIQLDTFNLLIVLPHKEFRSFHIYLNSFSFFSFRSKISDTLDDISLMQPQTVFAQILTNNTETNTPIEFRRKSTRGVKRTAETQRENFNQKRVLDRDAKKRRVLPKESYEPNCESKMLAKMPTKPKTKPPKTRLSRITYSPPQQQQALLTNPSSPPPNILANTSPPQSNTTCKY